MHIVKRVNRIRRIIMDAVTRNVGCSHLIHNLGTISNLDVKRILICRPNHRLGNLLLITPLLQEVIATFPHARIDLFVKGNLASSLFSNYENINHII